MPLINLILTWSANCVISARTATIQAKKFAINNAKLYVTFVALSTDDNAKLLQKSKSESILLV